MIWFCYLCKKNFFSWAWPMGILFLHKLGQKMVLFGGFSDFSHNYWIPQLKLLILIESLNIFHWKPAKKNQSGCCLGQNLGQIKSNVKKIYIKEMGIVNRLFLHILHQEYLLKLKVVVAQTPKWKFKANIARNATFEGCLGPNFC